MRAYLGLGGGGDDRGLEFLVLPHSVRDGYSADLAGTVLVGPPCAAGKVASDDHLYGQALAFVSDSDHGVGSGYFPVLDYVGCGIQEHRGYLVQHLSLVGYALGQDDIKCRYPVGGYHDYEVVVYGVDIAYLAFVLACLMSEIEVCLCNSFHNRVFYNVL